MGTKFEQRACSVMAVFRSTSEVSAFKLFDEKQGGAMRIAVVTIAAMIAV